jgi:formylglycine-generating enzyme required for sulfatase activity
MPNAYGLFDMHGGLWEFTSTPYPKEFAPEEVRSRELFVKRGGAYYNPARRCRSAQRNYATPDAADQYTGMRLVMELAR